MAGGVSCSAGLRASYMGCYSVVCGWPRCRADWRMAGAVLCNGANIRWLHSEITSEGYTHGSIPRLIYSNFSDDVGECLLSATRSFLIGEKRLYKVYCDFDETITMRDVGNQLVARYGTSLANDIWRDLEAGTKTAAQC